MCGGKPVKIEKDEMEKIQIVSSCRGGRICISFRKFMNIKCMTELFLWRSPIGSQFLEIGIVIGNPLLSAKLIY